MGAWPQCGLCPWRRTLHVYLLYTIYLVLTTGPCRTLSRSANTTTNSVQEVPQNFSCEPVCEKTDFQQQACMTKEKCNGKLSCSSTRPSALECNFHCNNQFKTAVQLSMPAACGTDDIQEENIKVKCDTMNGSSLQFEPDSSSSWSDIFAERQFDVTCFPVAHVCTSTARCCLDQIVWNCRITTVAVPTPTTTSTSTSKTPSKPKRSTTTPRTSTNSTTPPSTSKTTTTTTSSTSTTTTAPPSTLKKRTSTLKTSTLGSKSPKVSTSTTSTQTVTEGGSTAKQTVTEGGSTARQTDSNPLPTIAVAVGSMLVLSIVVISIIVIIVLRRNRRRKKAKNPVFIVNNTAYGAVTKHPEYLQEPDNPKSSSKIPAKPEADEEHSYCYASFDDSQQNVNPEAQHVQDSNHTMTSLDDSYFVLENDSKQHGNSNRTEQPNVLEQLGVKETARSENKLDKPSNYFVLEKLEPAYDTKRPETDVSSNYFVLETTSREHDIQRSYEEEISDTDGTCSGNADDNYFLVGTNADDRQAPAVSSEHSATVHQDHISDGNYFVLEKPTDDLEVVTHKETDLSPRMQNSRNTETRANPRTNGTPTPTHDPYDHVRVGHVHTNGYDDGVYDELRKQHVRYDTEDVENDYDHC